MLSKRALKIEPSFTLSISAKAKEMKKKGIDVVSFGAGEPDMDTPAYIKEAAAKALRDGFTKYTATSGIPELKEAICAKFKKDNRLTYAPENILVSNGAKQCLYELIQVLVDPGDEVIIPVPYWVSYKEMVKLAGGVCVFSKKNEFKKSISKKTKLLILNSPSNPSGYAYLKKELESIAGICVKRGIAVISDEIYEKLIYDKPHVSIASLNKKIKELAFVVNGVSKSHSMTGWRVGYCAGKKEVIKAASALQDHLSSNPNSIAQKAAYEALKNEQESGVFIAKTRLEYKKRRDYMHERLSKIEGVKADLPDGAFYIFADVSGFYNKKIYGSVEFCEELLGKFHVVAIPGIAFGNDNYIRFSYATNMENIKKGMDRFNSFLSDF